MDRQIDRAEAVETRDDESELFFHVNKQSPLKLQFITNIKIESWTSLHRVGMGGGAP